MFDGDIAARIHEATTWVLPVLFAIPLHEAAHGIVAWRLGDDTAYRMGRVTLNPLRHIDPFGTVVLPALLKFLGSGFIFGYAKPVPVAFHRLRHPRRDTVLVALAGPVTNILLAILSALLVHAALMLPSSAAEWATTSLVNSIQLNVILAVFNMIPLPPLDGGRVAVGILPRPLGDQLARVERQGILILLALLIFLPMLGQALGTYLNLIPEILLVPANFVYKTILPLTGLA